jgi:hypothetical protein
MGPAPRRARTAEIDRPAPIALAGTAFRFDDDPITVQLDDLAAVEQP